MCFYSHLSCASIPGLEQRFPEMIKIWDMIAS
jgi:hypothetical protein